MLAQLTWNIRPLRSSELWAAASEDEDDADGDGGDDQGDDEENADSEGE